MDATKVLCGITSFLYLDVIKLLNKGDIVEVTVEDNSVFVPLVSFHITCKDDKGLTFHSSNNIFKGNYEFNMSILYFNEAPFNEYDYYTTYELRYSSVNNEHYFVEGKCMINEAYSVFDYKFKAFVNPKSFSDLLFEYKGKNDTEWRLLKLNIIKRNKKGLNNVK